MLRASALWSHHAEFAARPASIVGVRWFVAVNLREHGVGNLVDDVQLAASELATNAILHAQTPFSVTLEGFDHAVVLTMRDGSDALPVRTNASPMASGGRGLAIVDGVSSSWGVHQATSGEKRIWAAFDCG